MKCNELKHKMPFIPNQFNALSQPNETLSALSAFMDSSQAQKRSHAPNSGILPGRSPLQGKMAARRVAKSAVDWAAFKDRVPVRQQEFYRAFKAKNDTFVNKVHQYAAELPKIDFAYYKARLPNPALADQFHKAYESINIPYPTDKNNMLKDIDADQKAAEELSKVYVAERQEEINDANLLLSKIDSLPKPDQMTLEMYAYYFPNLAIDPVKRPTFWPHLPSMQPGHKDNHNI